MSSTKIILVKDVYNLGEEGDVKDVKRGYARNFLIPQGLAVDNSLQNRNTLEKKRALIEKKKLEKKQNAGLLKEKLQSEVITISVPAGDKGRLYGTVTNAQIYDEIIKKGYTVDRKSVELKEHIKVAGKYKFSVHLYNDVYADMDLVVAAQNEEKKTDHRVKSAGKRRREENTTEESAE